MEKIRDSGRARSIGVSNFRVRDLQKILDMRRQAGAVVPERDVFSRTRDYLEIFSVFKEEPDAEALVGILDVYSGRLTAFERSAIGE